MRIPSNHCPRTLGRYIKVFAIEARDIASPYWREDLSNQDRDFDVRLSVKAGLRSVGAGLVQRNWAMDSVGPSRLPVAYYYNFLGNGHAQKMGVGSIEITGPLNHSGRGDSTSRRQVFISYAARQAARMMRSVPSRFSRSSRRALIGDPFRIKISWRCLVSMRLLAKKGETSIQAFSGP